VRKAVEQSSVMFKEGEVKYVSDTSTILYLSTDSLCANYNLGNLDYH